MPQLPRLGPSTEPLSAQEELDLARRHRAGDKRAGHRLIEGNLRLVQHIAGVWHHLYGYDIEEMYSVGCLGLLDALRKYDPDKGVRFGKFAAYDVRARMSRAGLLSRSVTATVGIQNRAGWGLGKLAKKLSGESGEWIEAEELGKAAGRSPGAIRALRAIMAGDVPLNRRVRFGSKDGAEEHRELQDRFASPDPSPEDLMEEAWDRVALRTVITEALAELPARDRKLLELRYLAEVPLTLREVAPHLGIKFQRVHQIEQAALWRIRHALLRRAPGQVCDSWLQAGEAPLLRTAGKDEIRLRAKVKREELERRAQAGKRSTSTGP